jgi:16S rRNA (cytidine1402-2'-O)-methyltransferase
LKEKSLFFLVPTPIGNLEDITLRALRILREVDMILAEDTRKASILLRHHSIRNKLRSFHAFNEHKLLPEVIGMLKKGDHVALISDAGTPGISDPGYLIARECIRHQIPFECLPGPVALIPALLSSGLPSGEFLYAGFLPVKKGRNKALNDLAGETRTMVFYESPHKLARTLADLTVLFGKERPASVSRELTKLHEETIRGSLEFIISHFEKNPPRGELVIVVAGKES